MSNRSVVVNRSQTKITEMFLWQRDVSVEGNLSVVDTAIGSFWIPSTSRAGDILGIRVKGVWQYYVLAYVSFSDNAATLYGVDLNPERITEV